MKRLFTIITTLCLLLTAHSASAHKPHVGYHGEIVAGASVGISELQNHRLQLHTIQGVSIGEGLTAGIGFGADLYTAADFEGDFDIMVPIYANFKAFAPTRGVVDPFLSLDLGGSVGVTNPGVGGLMIGASVGFKARAFIWSFGYSLQQFGDKNMALNSHSLQLKIGVAF